MMINDLPLVETTIYDYIELNGRISKKLFQKIVEPKLAELEIIKAENKKLREALSHYANKYCWQGTHIGPSDYWFDDTQGYWLGGKRARETLKEVDVNER